MIRIVYTGSRPPETVIEGVEVHHLPMLETVPVAIPDGVKKALQGDGAPFVVFYSKNAAEYVVGTLGPEVFQRCRVWAVGQRTAEFLTDKLGVEVRSPEIQNFEGLVDELSQVVDGHDVVISFELASGSRRLSRADVQGEIVSVSTYDTCAYNYDDLDGLLRRIAPRWVIFASPRGHEAFKSNLHHRSIGDSYRVAALGPKTRDAIVEAGDRVDFTPEDPDLETLLRELADA